VDAVRANLTSSVNSWSRPARPSAVRLRFAFGRRKRTAGAVFEAIDRGEDREPRAWSCFKLFSDKIETPGDGLIIFRGLQESHGRLDQPWRDFALAWIDEAQSLSARSLALLAADDPRKESELWASWNPRRKSDAIDDFLRGRRPDGALVVKANWRDNPWFPDVLREERLLDQKLYPERYDHIWEGEYAAPSRARISLRCSVGSAYTQGGSEKSPRIRCLPLRRLHRHRRRRGCGGRVSTIWIVQCGRKRAESGFSKHLRRWRKSVEQAQSYTFKAVITVIATGLMGAVWLGCQGRLGQVNSQSRTFRIKVIPRQLGSSYDKIGSSRGR